MACERSSSIQFSLDLDEIFTHVCDPCQYEGDRAEATGFCTVCQEYLCFNCLKSHKRSRVSRDHKILEGDDMDRVQSFVRKSKGSVFCEIHKDKEIDTYCFKHDEVLCQMCATTEHRKCPDVSSIVEICKDRKENQQNQDFLRETKTLIQKFKDISRQRMKDKDKLTQQQQDCSKDMKHLKDALKNLVDRLEVKGQDEVKKTLKTECQMITSRLSGVDNAVQSLEDAVKNLEKSLSAGDEQAFIARKRE